MKKFYIDYFNKFNEIYDEFVNNETNLELIKKFENEIIKTIKNNGIFIFAGNGGSYADALHFSAEFSGKFINYKRKPLKSITLGSNGSSLTAISNDFGYKDVFSREIDPYLKDEDYILVLLSTSGSSKNILNILNIRNLNKKKIFLFTGKNLKKKIKINSFKFNSLTTSHIQECYKLLIHSVLLKLNL